MNMMLSVVTRIDEPVIKETEIGFYSMLGALQAVLNICKNHGYEPIDTKEHESILNVALFSVYQGRDMSKFEQKEVDYFLEKIRDNHNNINGRLM